MKLLSKTARAAWAPLLAAAGVALFGAWTADAFKGATPFVDWHGSSAHQLALCWRLGSPVHHVVERVCVHVPASSWVCGHGAEGVVLVCPHHGFELVSVDVCEEVQPLAVHFWVAIRPPPPMRAFAPL